MTDQNNGGDPQEAQPAVPPAGQAIPVQGKPREYAPCPCGKGAPAQLLIEMPGQQSKIGRAVCGTCQQWSVEFYRGLVQDPEQILDAAQAAWDSAPRPSEVQTPDS